MNGDILTDLDMTAMLALHRERGAAATIALHHVEDARAFGLVDLESDGSSIVAFREKPDDAVPGDVNAGTYVFDPAALARWIADRPISVEREIFPGVIASGRPVVGFGSDAYWRDLGTPQNYLQAHFDLLDGKVRGRTYDAPVGVPRRRASTCEPTSGGGSPWARVRRSVAEAQVDDSVRPRRGVHRRTGRDRRLDRRSGGPGGSRRLDRRERPGRRLRRAR